MATVKDTGGEQGAVAAAAVEEEDIRGDGKKKKFKPLSAMRKFFGKKRKKEEGEGVVAVKAKSTTALHSRLGDDEDDDDGGFKSHEPPKSLVNTRSISEDSIFSPEVREANINLFQKSSLSEESLPRSTFQSELLTKLTKRRSQGSDDDRDDGLPRSPVLPPTTADLILGDALKAPPVKKSSNRDSDQSLISVDSSENEEEDLFRSKWKSTVPSIKSKDGRPLNMSDAGRQESMDFSTIQKTEVLLSTAAKDRISIKPKSRKASRKSQKARETSSPHSLPSLSEESPSRSRSNDTVKVTVSSELPGTKPADKVPQKTEDLSPAQASSSPMTKSGLSSPTSSSEGAAKPSVSSIMVTSGSQKGKESSFTPSPVSPGIKSSPFLQSKKPETTTASETSHSAVTPSSSSQRSDTWITAGTSPQNVEARSPENVSSSPMERSKSPGDLKSPSDVKASYSIKSRTANFENAKTSSAVSFNSRVQVSDKGSEGTSLKVADPDSSVTLSPKEGYKLKREGRSKTLPAATDEQASSKIQRVSSQRVQGSPGSSVTPTEPEAVAKPPPAETSTTVKKLDTSRFAGITSNNSSSQPSWMRRKITDEASSSEVEADKSSGWSNKTPSDSQPSSTSLKATSVVASDTSASTINPVSKSVFGHASGQGDKKRGSIVDISPLKHRDSLDQGRQKENDPSSSNSSSANSKRPSIDAGPRKRESIEIDVSELNSVKALSSSFSGNKSNTPTPSRNFPTKDKSNVPSSSAASSSNTSTAERAKMFSVTGPASVTFSPKSNVTKQSEPTDSNSDNIRPSGGGGISHFRGGSVKTSPTKTADIKSSFPARGGSVKTPSYASSASTSSTTTSKSTGSNPLGGNKSDILTKSTNSFVHGAPDAHSKSDTPTPAVTHLPSEKTSNRSSKVLDLVKNFQNLQVPS